ncbi:MAG: hypothetical protein ACR2KD_07980 [Thermoleophilaceae bacterium]|jgi:hypothetical protein
MDRVQTSREDLVAEGRRTDESEQLIEAARESADGAGTRERGTSPPAEAQNQATAPPGNGELDESALADGLHRLEQAGGGH